MIPIRWNGLTLQICHPPVRIWFGWSLLSQSVESSAVYLLVRLQQAILQQEDPVRSQYIVPGTGTYRYVCLLTY
eukprot:scaffold155_cov57-Attheya_sp.AAC.2